MSNWRGMPYPPIVFILEGVITCLKRKPRRCKYRADNWRLYWFFGYDITQSIYKWDEIYKPNRINYTDLGKVPSLEWKKHNKEISSEKDQ